MQIQSSFGSSPNPGPQYRPQIEGPCCKDTHKTDPQSMETPECKYKTPPPPSTRRLRSRDAPLVALGGSCNTAGLLLLGNSQRPNKREIPERILSRILMLVWSFGPYRCEVRSPVPLSPTPEVVARRSCDSCEPGETSSGCGHCSESGAYLHTCSYIHTCIRTDRQTDRHYIRSLHVCVLVYVHTYRYRYL